MKISVWYFESEATFVTKACDKKEEKKITIALLEAQRQIWDIFQGKSFLGVKFTRKILAWYGK